MPLFAGFNLFTGTRMGPGIGSGDVTSYSREPSDLGIDTANGRLFISDDDKDRIFIVSPGVRRRPRDHRRHRHQLPHGALWKRRSRGGRLRPDDRRPVRQRWPRGRDLRRQSGQRRVRRRKRHRHPLRLAQYGAGDCEGLGINPARGTLLCVDPSTPDNIYELGKGGALFRVLSMAAIPTSHAVVADVTMAPTSNPNDGPAPMNYWIVDRHLDNATLSRTKTTGSCTRCFGGRAPGDDDHLRPGVRDQRPDAELQLLLVGGRPSFECKLDSGAYGACTSPNTSRTSPMAPTPSTCVPSMRPGTSTPRRPRGASRSAPPRSGSRARPWWSQRRWGPRTTWWSEAVALDPAGDRRPQRLLHGLRRPHRFRLHAQSAPTPPTARPRGSTRSRSAPPIRPTRSRTSPAVRSRSSGGGERPADRRPRSDTLFGGTGADAFKGWAETTIFVPGTWAPTRRSTAGAPGPPTRPTSTCSPWIPTPRLSAARRRRGTEPLGFIYKMR